jgi:quercetin dioxygenase-like cupin family protein
MKAAMAKPAILRPTEIEARSRGGGVRTIPLVTRKVGSTSLINGITIVDPGAAVPLHSHNCEESVVILSGRAMVEIEGIEHEVAADDTTFLPANIPHRFRNASQTEVLRILWTYASVDATRTIVSTGQTRSIDDEHDKPTKV